MKKLFACLLALCMLLSMLPAAVFAADSGTCGESATWELVDGTLTISGTGAVTERPWQSNPFGVKKLIVEEGITDIVDAAFSGCTNMVSVSLPKGLTRVGKRLFDGCFKLTAVVIPEGVTVIEENAFSGCGTIRTVHIPSTVTTIAEGAFSRQCDVYITDMNAWLAIDFADESSNPMSDGGNLYLNGALVTEVVIPEGTEVIKKLCFSGCKSLTSVTLPEGLKEIGASAFFLCPITQITLPQSLKKIGASAFRQTGLTRIDLPSGLEEIGGGAFYYCPFTEVTVPGSVSVIGGGAFESCSNLERVTICEGVQEIGASAFSWCQKLTSIEIPETVTQIGKSAFSSCNALTQIDLPSGITTIEDDTFDYCRALESISIPASVTYIGIEAFGRCTSLNTIRFEGDPARIARDAFLSVNATVYYPESYDSIAGTSLESSSGQLVWAAVSDPSDTVSVMNEDGTIHVQVAEGSSARVGIRRSPDLDEGYVFCTLNPDGTTTPVPGSLFLGNGITYSLIQATVHESCTLVIENKALPAFTDTEGYWSNDEFDRALQYLTAREIIKGKTSELYVPRDSIQRKTVALVLWRIAGCPEVELDTELTDVDLNSKTYAQAICWAEDTGIITGYSDKTFRGDDLLQRRHFALMLYRFVNYMDVELPDVPVQSLSDFTDSHLIGAASEEACQWALDCMIIRGRSFDTYDPLGTTSRGQMAVILYRMLPNYYAELAMG